ncbi:amidohydrolase family protein [Immundisolibacter sp.]|uniref:N-acyl-D-amino-acid deacylase family protein n=1 Tax=Immundisolibacter sp. TaxID=1934948 RepID=UPI00261BBE95|nr:amidohydrolase family protein [Immundisolibacter sp.]MDD3651984.1 amidohydrolase family protein [Immundisolibacter sp.]
MMYDLLIENARIVDGTGAPAYPGGVAVKAGRIVALGAVMGEAAQRIDANGEVVAPGFVDPHTHFDAQVVWDALLTPSAEHGVTTAVMGNCGVGTAPVRADMREFLMGDLVNVEGIPLDVMRAGIDWQWEHFGDYLDALDRRGLGINVAPLVAMTPLRHYAMGAASLERAANPDEIASMTRAFAGAMEAGAFGYSTTREGVHVGYQGKPVACRNASLDEHRALCGVLRDVRRGAVELALKLGGEMGQDEHDFLELLVRESSRPVTWLAVVNAAEQPRSYEQRLAAVADLTGWDKAVPQTTCRPLRFQLNLANPYILGVFPSWQPVMRLSREQKLATYADPKFRQSFRDDLETIPAFGRDIWSRFYVLDGVSDQARDIARSGQSLRQLADASGRDPMDLLVEIAVEDELRSTFDLIALNYDPADTIPLVQDDRLLIGLSDAGAHLDMLCDAGYSTHLLQRWVRETGALTLEQGVRKLTSIPAQLFGIDRGVLAVGKAADLVIFDPATVACGDKQWATDLPGGGRRFVTHSTGVRATIVAGEVLFENGAYRDGARPGRVLRSYQA